MLKNSQNHISINNLSKKNLSLGNESIVNVFIINPFIEYYIHSKLGAVYQDRHTVKRRLFNLLLNELTFHNH